MGVYNEKVLAMEEYCLKDELEFLQLLIGGNLREKIEKRIGHLSARIKSIEINKKCLEEGERVKWLKK